MRLLKSVARGQQSASSNFPWARPNSLLGPACLRDISRLETMRTGSTLEAVLHGQQMLCAISSLHP